MLRSGLVFGWLFASAALLAAPRNVSLVLYPGQELTYIASAPLLTVNAGSQKAVATTFEQYGTRIQLRAKALGDATLLCEHADNRIGEIVAVTVVPKARFDVHQRALNALRGIEGLTPADVVVAGDVVVTGNVYSQADLDRCIALERAEPSLVCGARLSSAAAIVTPAMGYAARANIEAGWEAEAFTAADAAGGEVTPTWTVTVRLGDVPVFHAESTDRARLLTTAARLTRKLNGVIAAWRAESETKGTPYPVTFRSRSRADGFEWFAHWSFRHGSAGEALVTIPLNDLAGVAAEAGVAPDLLVQWWLALLHDAFRLYFMAERPVRTVANASDASPLVRLYQSALRLRGTELDDYTAQVAVARAWFALALSTGRDPFEKLLSAPPADFAVSSP